MGKALRSPSGRLLVSGCDVLRVPLTGDCEILREQDITVADGVIESVAPSGVTSSFDGAEVIDGRGLLATPGLVNAHTHSPMVLMRGAAEDVSVEAWFNQRVWPIESNLTADDVALGARLACAEMIGSGVTTFADHYFFPERIAEAVTESGLRADIAPTYFSSRGQEALESSVAFAEGWHGRADGRVTVSLGPHAPYTVDDEDLRTLADHARRLGLRMHIHAAENVEQTESSLRRRGVTPVQVLHETGVLDAGALIAHGCGIGEGDLPLLAAHAERTAVACCPKVYLKHALSPLTPVRALLGAGVTVAVGTDGAAGHNTLDVWEALRLVALTQKQAVGDATWMNVSDTLRLATRGGARALGLGDVVGALEPGMRADIALVDLSGPHCRPLHDERAALVYSVRASDVRTVIVDGRVLMRDRNVLTVDVPAVLAEIDERVGRLLDISHGKAVQHYDP
ncbi:amidohydrolase [Lentzea nigeriaca]|uniref:amidohydrolase n=1 Tax=Lentzea nigeriaca TaxID=1128665 RepID=UPI00195C820F|nr:amidohydrolase [Lentzea nigeriaca]MBM7857242.1 5-methylthioadenosine/S-adenosylhomocysteine deaminase [Lentzea nigeriaca]